MLESFIYSFEEIKENEDYTKILMAEQITQVFYYGVLKT